MKSLMESNKKDRKEELIISFTSFLSSNMFSLLLSKLFDTNEERESYFNKIMETWEGIHKKNISNLRKKFEESSESEKLALRLMGIGDGEEYFKSQEDVIEEVKLLITEDYKKIWSVD